MKRWLSVLTPAARLSVWKVLLLSVLAAGVQVLLFLTLSQKSNGEIPGSFFLLESAVQTSLLSLVFAVGLVLVCTVLVLPGTERGAKTGYTLRRLSVDERVVVLLWGGINALLLLTFCGVQTAAALALSQYYLQTLPAEFSNHQSLFLAFSRSPYLHALLPMWDWGLTIRNLLGCAVLGLSAAALPFHWRHGRKAWSTFPLAILAGFTFPSGMDGSAAYGIQLIVLAMTGVLTVFGVWRWHEDEE